METLAPILFMAAAARMAAETSFPATKRVETRWPMLERSATARRERLSESAMKVALSMVHLVLTDWGCQRRSLFLTWHYSIFYHKRRRIGMILRRFTSIK